jgi:predicted dehydrogenase
MGCYSLNQHQAPNESTITVVCTRGTVRFEYHCSRWRSMTEAGGAWHTETSRPLERDMLFIRQAEAFLDAIDGRRTPLCTLDEGTQSLQVNLAILASAEKRDWQTVRPDGANHG